VFTTSGYNYKREFLEHFITLFLQMHPVKLDALMSWPPGLVPSSSREKGQFLGEKSRRKRIFIK
jgi:hypothetical protein